MWQITYKDIYDEIYTYYKVDILVTTDFCSKS